MSGNESWGSNKVVCFVWCMLLDVDDDDDDVDDVDDVDDDVDDDDVDDDDDDDGDDDDDVALACRESRPERILLSS